MTIYCDCILQPQVLVIHPQNLLPWLPALLASSFNGVVYHAFIATVTLQDTHYTTAEVVAVQWVFLCLGLARVREPTLQHYWHPLPATPFRWQQLPALESLDHSVPLSLRQHHLQEVSLWDTRWVGCAFGGNLVVVTNYISPTEHLPILTCRCSCFEWCYHPKSWFCTLGQYWWISWVTSLPD